MPNQKINCVRVFGLDNVNFLIDGMPVNFRFPLSLSVTDFEVIDSLGNIHIPMNAPQLTKMVVLLLGEFGTAVTNPPAEVKLIYLLDTLPEESAYSEIINLKGITTLFLEGPSLFFAQRIDGSLNECTSGTQTIQVAWDGGITPYISGDTESDLFQYYIGFP